MRSAQLDKNTSHQMICVISDVSRAITSVRLFRASEKKPKEALKSLKTTFLRLSGYKCINLIGKSMSYSDACTPGNLDGALVQIWPATI